MAQEALGSLAQIKLRVTQLFASSICWWEGWVALLVPSHAGPQYLPMGKVRAKCVNDGGRKC